MSSIKSSPVTVIAVTGLLFIFLLNIENTTLSTQAFKHGWLAQFCQRTGLDLADAFAGDAQFAANLFERMSLAIAEAETQLKHKLLTRCQNRFQHALHFVFERLGGCQIFGGGGFGIG